VRKGLKDVLKIEATRYINRIALNLIRNEQPRKEALKVKDSMPDGITIVFWKS
jgi:hypothetical protein